MIQLLIAVLFFTSASAFAGISGSSGDSAPVGSLVTVKICIGEAGTCQNITYRVRAQSVAVEEVKCMVPFGETGELIPCPKNTRAMKYQKD